MPDQIQFAGSTVTITLEAPLKAGAGYHVKVDPTAIIDAAGNAFAGIADDTALTFSTAAPMDATPPTLTSSSPAAGAADVSVDSAIVLTFDEPVKAGTGNITISNGSDDARVVSVI